MTTNIFCPTGSSSEETFPVTFEEENISAEIVESHLTVSISGGAGGSASFPNKFTLTMVAGEDITQHTVVRSSTVSGQVLVADSSDNSICKYVMGIAATGSVSASPIDIISSGIHTDSAWSWLPGPIYFDSSGALTQTPPVTGFVLMVGKAISATEINVDVETPIILD